MILGGEEYFLSLFCKWVTIKYNYQETESKNLNVVWL